LRMISVLCSVLLFIPHALWLYAQENSGKTYEVRGTVINSVTHEPIARTLVTIAGETPSSQLTDNEGRFEFPNIPTGASVLQARRPGFFSPGSSNDFSQPITVGPDNQDHTLMLEPAGLITGQITTTPSDSDSDIRVQLMRRTVQEGRAHWLQVATK